MSRYENQIGFVEVSVLDESFPDGFPTDEFLSAHRIDVCVAPKNYAKKWARDLFEITDGNAIMFSRLWTPVKI